MHNIPLSFMVIYLAGYAALWGVPFAFLGFCFQRLLKWPTIKSLIAAIVVASVVMVLYASYNAFSSSNPSLKDLNVPRILVEHVLGWIYVPVLSVLLFWCPTHWLLNKRYPQ